MKIETWQKEVTEAYRPSLYLTGKRLGEMGCENQEQPKRRKILKENYFGEIKRLTEDRGKFSYQVLV